jgi:hypothetical protein
MYKQFDELSKSLEGISRRDALRKRVHIYPMRIAASLVVLYLVRRPVERLTDQFILFNGFARRGLLCT